MLCLRWRKKTSENMLFYNLDTPDLIENKYTHTVGAAGRQEKGA
jgi:hypothetical protein